jgi:integrase
MEIAETVRSAPTSVNVTVRSARPREYLTEREVEKLIDAARENRWGHRDGTAILIAYRHGLRASELVALRWDDIDFTAGKLHVRRAKGGMTSVHPIGGRELRALRRLQRETPDGARTVHIFVSERLAPLSVAGYQRMVARAGAAADFPFLVHSHMLRHSCGYKLANAGTTRGPSSTTSGTGQSRPPCGTRLWRRIGSRAFGRIEPAPTNRPGTRGSPPRNGVAANRCGAVRSDA